MVNIFTREITDDLAGLVKEVDKAVAANEDKKMAAFVVLLTDDPDAAEGQLEEFASKHQIENVPLTIYDGIAGPPAYKIAEDAAVTVMLWRKIEVQANHAFPTAQLTEKDVRAVMKDTEKILD